MELAEKKKELMQNVKHVCLTCDNLSLNFKCFVYNSKPPTKALEEELGCEKWEYFEVPF